MNPQQPISIQSKRESGRVNHVEKKKEKDARHLNQQDTSRVYTTARIRPDYSAVVFRRGDARRGLLGEGELELVEDELQVFLRVGVARHDDLPPVASG